jgi:hypothetical protein
VGEMQKGSSKKGRIKEKDLSDKKILRTSCTVVSISDLILVAFISVSKSD